MLDLNMCVRPQKPSFFISQSAQDVIEEIAVIFQDIRKNGLLHQQSKTFRTQRTPICLRATT